MTVRRRRKIDWAAANFAFALVMAVLVAVLAYGYFNGNVNARLDSLTERVKALEAAQHRRP